MRVVLTNAWPRAGELAARLRMLGHQVLTLPFARIESRVDPAVRSHLNERVGSADVVVAVSPGALAVLFDALDRPWPAGTRLAVIGPGSLAALSELAPGFDRSRVLLPASAPWGIESLLRRAPFDRPRGLRVLALVGRNAGSAWVDDLRAAGAEVELMRIYANQAITPEAEQAETLANWACAATPLVSVFSSVEIVRRCDGWLRASGLASALHARAALAIHPRIVDALRERGWTHVELIEPGETGLLTALESLG